MAINFRAGTNCYHQYLDLQRMRPLSLYQNGQIGNLISYEFESPVEQRDNHL